MVVRRKKDELITLDLLKVGDLVDVGNCILGIFVLFGKNKPIAFFLGQNSFQMNQKSESYNVYKFSTMDGKVFDISDTVDITGNKRLCRLISPIDEETEYEDSWYHDE